MADLDKLRAASDAAYPKCGPLTLEEDEDGGGVYYTDGGAYRGWMSNAVMKIFQES